jgi:hypothetical protein
VAKTDEKDSKLDANGMLRDVGVVMEDVMIFDEFYQAVEDDGGDSQFLSEAIWMVFFKVE